MGKIRIVRSLLKGLDVALDSLSGIPGAGALKELKDGTDAVLERAEGLRDGNLSA